MNNTYWTIFLNIYCSSVLTFFLLMLNSLPLVGRQLSSFAHGLMKLGSLGLFSLKPSFPLLPAPLCHPSPCSSWLLTASFHLAIHTSSCFSSFFPLSLRSLLVLSTPLLRPLFYFPCTELNRDLSVSVDGASGSRVGGWGVEGED